MSYTIKATNRFESLDALERAVLFNERLFSKVEIDEDGCWIWQRGLYDGIYGAVWWVNWNVRTHIIAYQLTYGIKLLEGECVLHHCDKPLCIKPSCLFKGLDRDNHKDMQAKGRHAHGSTHGSSKLHEDDIPVIRQMVKSGISQRKVATYYGVAHQQISNIVLGRTWTHVN